MAQGVVSYWDGKHAGLVTLLVRSGPTRGTVPSTRVGDVGLSNLLRQLGLIYSLRDLVLGG